MNKLKQEQLRQELLERYISTGMVGLTRPNNVDHAIDLIETVVSLYDDTPIKMSLTELADKYKDLLDRL